MRKVSKGGIGEQSRSGSTNLREKSILLNKLATQKKIQENFDHREYRLVTGSDDGYVFFWNIPYDMVAEARSQQLNSSMTEKKLNQANLGRLTKSKKNVGGLQKVQHPHQRRIPEFKPKYELFLSAYANIQSLILCNEYLVALDNDSTVSILRCKIHRPPPQAIEFKQKIASSLPQLEAGAR